MKPRGKAADAARWKAAEELGLPIEEGRVIYPDAQLEYTDAEGRTGRVNVEVASEHYRSGSIVSKAAAGFEMHGNGGRATANIQRTGPGPDGTWDARSISSNARSAAGKGSRSWPTS